MKTLKLPVLTYELKSLSPHISETTLNFHYGKHLAAYINNVNSMLENTEVEYESLEDMVVKADGALFNNAAQAWNHIFYFEQFRSSANAIEGALSDKIIEQWGSIEVFIKEFNNAAATLFGSGWVWLSIDKNMNLEITKEQDAGNPLTYGKTPLLTIDVWEHAYYLDYQNRRVDYINIFWKIINWETIEARYLKSLNR